MEVGSCAFDFGKHERLHLLEVLGDTDDLLEAALDYVANGVHLGLKAEVRGVLFGFDAHFHQGRFDEGEVFVFVTEVVAALT